MSVIDVFDKLWRINCIVYVSIISWYLTNDVKCEIKRENRKTNNKAKWLEALDSEIHEKRRLISQCVAEIERIKDGLRMTRKARRNREKFEKLGINPISVCELTKLACKLKAQIHRKAQTRRKKLKNEKARKWNHTFRNNQSRIFKDFKSMIEKDPENEMPKFREVERERKFFPNSETVLDFWKSLWCKDDAGNPRAEWLKDYEDLFEQLVPIIDTDELSVTNEDMFGTVKRKRNWSAPGPDLIVNFWWKKLVVIILVLKDIFLNIINLRLAIENWFSRGRTNLIEKQGEWIHDNTRPITCTNTLYKWYTSVLLFLLNQHKKKFNIMQIDQRGAKNNCSGTVENLLIDNMVLQDAHDGKRNLVCSWVDIKKAYDSLSHSWIKRMLSIHRFPLLLQQAIVNVIGSWNVQLIIPLEEGDIVSDPIPILNGILQGDTMCGDIYTLSTNPVSWELRRYDGYRISKPINISISHSLFIDDLKAYTDTIRAMRIVLSEIKEKMKDGGLGWNNKKCKVLEIKRGKIETSQKELVLFDGSKIELLKSKEDYKFLGVPENTLHDVEKIVENMLKTIKQRSSIIWSSPLSDYNKIMATNIFVHSPMEYFMWSERFNLNDIRDLDKCIREVMNTVKAKYSLQMNASLYLPRQKGGRGLQNLESVYKRTKIKAAINLIENTDPRIQCVKSFDMERMKKGKSSIIKDAVKYAADDFQLKFILSDSEFEMEYIKANEVCKTSDKNKVKQLLKQMETAAITKEIEESTWQGLLLRNRYNDEQLVDGCFRWLTEWKDCPVQVINDAQSIYLQTTPTLSFTSHRNLSIPNSTSCRLCGTGKESVKHLLSNCQKFVKMDYKRRHDRVLQYIVFKFLQKHSLVSTTPPWYTKIVIKPHYENNDISVFWDIPEYTGHDDEQEEKALRPDGKIIRNDTKKIYVLEMSIPWIENREIKIVEKIEKYKSIVQTLKAENPSFEVKQLTFIVDCLGGYSKSFYESLKTLEFNKNEIDRISLDAQKIVISEATNTINKFKVLTIQ